jgi:hypothetical protein
MKEYKLCYVSGQKAYFTTQDIKEQWGDDWDDAPYEHNAGIPYKYDDHDKAKGKEPWDIFELYYESKLETPNTWVSNSNYSVQDINKGAVAWLESPRYDKEGIRLYGGTTLGEFINVIKRTGGSVYLPIIK